MISLSSSDNGGKIRSPVVKWRKEGSGGMSVVYMFAYGRGLRRGWVVRVDIKRKQYEGLTGGVRWYIFFEFFDRKFLMEDTIFPTFPGVK